MAEVSNLIPRALCLHIGQAKSPLGTRLIGIVFLLISAWALNIVFSLFGRRFLGRGRSIEGALIKSFLCLGLGRILEGALART